MRDYTYKDGRCTFCGCAQEGLHHSAECYDLHHSDEPPMPTFDSDGYPTDATLELIRTWPLTDVKALAEFVRDAWSDYGHLTLAPCKDVLGKDATRMLCVTGGWSGNESIIEALMDNMPFRFMCWESTHRGGLVVFEIRQEADHA